MLNVFVIIPCYNESEVLPKLFEILKKLKNDLSSKSVNLNYLFVNDGSKDNSLDLIREFIQGQKESAIINFTGNFGHQNALLAGFKHLVDKPNLDYVFIIDADLQDPPELLSEFLAKAKLGYNIINGVRAKRNTSFIKKYLYSYFYKFFNNITTRGSALNIGDFCLIDNKALKYICQYNEKIPYLRGIRNLIGLKNVNIEYDRPERVAGLSKYSYISLITLALSGIIGFSDKLFPKIIIWGLVTFIISILLFVLALVQYFFWNKFIAVTCFISIVTFLTALFLLNLGILGSYLYVISIESKSRPNYLIDEIIYG